MTIFDEFRAFLVSIDNQELADWHELSLSGPLEPSQIQALEAASGVQLPQELRQLLLDTGPVASENYVDVWNTLSIAPTDEAEKSFDGVVNYIDYVWGGRPELAASLSPQQIARLNAEFRVFGRRYVDDNVHDYFLFDSNGRFHNLLLDQDNMVDCIEWLRSASIAAPAGTSLETLLEQQFVAIKQGIKEELEEGM